MMPHIQAPWWVKIIVKIFLSRLPVSYDFWRSIGIFKHGKMDQAEYLIEVFEDHCNRADVLEHLRGKHILELGPGDSVGSAIVAASFGASITLLDSGYFAKSNITFYRKLSSDLAKRGLSAPNLKDASTIEDILKLCNAKYFTEGLDSFRFIASDSVDFVFSNAVLEHVRKKIFKPQLMKHLGSWLLVGKHRIGLIFGIILGAV